MRNLILTLCLIATFAMADGWKFPGWQSTDVAAYQEALDTAQDAYQLRVSTYMLALAENPPASFDEAKATITAALQGLDRSDEWVTESVKQYCYCTRKFSEEVVAFAKANPSCYDYNFAIHEKSEWGFQTMSEVLLKSEFNMPEAMRGVDYLVRQGIELDKDDAEMLALLRKLNRVYSAKLVKDKEKWSPIVAQIRTLMETYE